MIDHEPRAQAQIDRESQFHFDVPRAYPPHLLPVPVGARRRGDLLIESNQLTRRAPNKREFSRFEQGQLQGYVSRFIRHVHVDVPCMRIQWNSNFEWTFRVMIA